MGQMTLILVLLIPSGLLIAKCLRAADKRQATLVSIAHDMDMEQELKAEVLTLLGCDRRDAQYLEEAESADIEEACKRG